MKKQILFLFATLSTLFITLTASAQGEWKWVHYWSGSGGEYNNVFNSIINTAFDEEGNVYVYGTIGGSPVLNGELLPFTGPIEVTTTMAPGIMLAKFDTLGNMLWFKLVKCSNNGGMVSKPHWMEIRGNKIYISGSTGLWGDHPSGTWVYYMDTLIRKSQVNSLPSTERKPPFKNSMWTFFAQFDYEGNLIDDHFVETCSREFEVSGSNQIRRLQPLCLEKTAPFHVDSDENTYVYTYLEYKGNEYDPYTLVVDGDTNKIYDIYLPGTWQQGAIMPYLYNAMIYKFSPNWDLVYAKRIVNHTEGIATSWEYLGDSINPSFVVHPTGLSFDVNDNLYLSGNLIITMHDENTSANLHQYPIRIYWDSTHYATIQDMSGTRRLNYIIKYDTSGNVLWCNQIYTKGNPFSSPYAFAELYGNCYHNNSLYLTGRGTYSLDESVGVFFDSSSTIRLQGPQNIVTNIGYFARYDASNGVFLNYGVVPAIEGNSSASPGPVLAVINNRVFALSLYKQFSWDPAIIQWSNEGNFICHIPFSTGQSELGTVNANQKGTLLIDMVAFSPVTFSNNVVADCNNPGGSHAVFALYQDPTFVEPYVGIPNYGDDLSNLRIWPNPVNNFLNVVGDSNPIDYITIMDLSGKILMRKIVGNNNTILDVSLLSAGTYLLETVCKGEISVNKFVKIDG